MALDASEKEQIEMIKNWWRENGKFTLFSVIAVLLLSFGWRYWQNSKAQDTAEASLLYEQMLSHQKSNEMEFDVTSLISLHPKTPYAAFAAFIAAQHAVKNKNFSEAINKLTWVIEKSHNKDFRQIARLRVSRLFLEEKRYDEAMHILEKIEVPSYLPAINEVKGDIFLAMGNKQQARNAYQTALNMIKKDTLNFPNTALLQMKFEQLDG